MRRLQWIALAAGVFLVTSCGGFKTNRDNQRHGATGSYGKQSYDHDNWQNPYATRTAPSLTSMGSTPALRFFEFSQNHIAHLTHNLSDWDRAILDGDIQRLLNTPYGNSQHWAAPNSGAVTARLVADAPYTERRALPVRRLHILNQTPGELQLVSGEWRSWGGALLRSAPTSDTKKTIGRLAPASKTEVLGEVRSISGQSWYLVGHEGIGIGYVAKSDLRKADKWTKTVPGSKPSFNRSVNLDFAPTITDQVFATTNCRNLSIADASMTACKGVDDRWRAD